MPTRSIYLDDATDAIANELMESTGQRMSTMFREFLVRWKAAQGLISHLAVIQDTSALIMGDEDDPYRVDRWVDTGNTKKVFLMGVTMRDLLVRYEELWRVLLSNGARVQVLRQGGLQNRTSEIAAVLASPRGHIGDDESAKKELFDRRGESNEVLRRLALGLNGASDRLEVRDSDDRLLTYSQLLIWKQNPSGEVDAQLHPYVPGYRFSPGPRFIVSTNESSRSFSALIKPVADLWSLAKKWDPHAE